MFIRILFQASASRTVDKIEDGDRTLLDSTAVLFGSGIGDANSHKNSDLPIVLAGGGYRHGQVIGSTNDKGEYPTSRKIGVEDFCAIVYHSMGLKVDDSIVDLTGRPTHLVPGGEVPVELL
jgi:hypothetical protein